MGDGGLRHGCTDQLDMDCGLPARSGIVDTGKDLTPMVDAGLEPLLLLV